VLLNGYIATSLAGTKKASSRWPAKAFAGRKNRSGPPCSAHYNTVSEASRVDKTLEGISRKENPQKIMGSRRCTLVER
jgi:hypothetical protein